MSVSVNISVCKDVSESEKREYIDRLMKIYRSITNIIQRDVDVYKFMCRKKLNSLIEYLLLTLKIIDDIDTKNCVWEPYTSSRIESLEYHVEERLRDLERFKCCR